MALGRSHRELALLLHHSCLSVCAGALALMFAVDPRRMKYTLLSSTSDMAHALLHGDQPSPGSSCSTASSTHDNTSVISSSTGAGLTQSYVIIAGYPLHQPPPQHSMHASSNHLLDMQHVERVAHVRVTNVCSPCCSSTPWQCHHVYLSVLMCRQLPGRCVV
jgi:hypothetical protein